MNDFIAGGHALPLALACLSSALAIVSLATLAVVHYRRAPRYRRKGNPA